MTRFLRSVVCAVTLAIAAAAAAPIPGLAKTFDATDGPDAAIGGDVSALLLNDVLRGKAQKAADQTALDGVAQLFRENHPRASVALNNYFARHPSDPAAFDLAGTILMGEGKYDAAVLSYERAMVVGTPSVWGRAKLGMAEMHAGRTDSGVRRLEAVLRKDPKNPIARRYLAWVALQSGDLPTAILHTESMLKAGNIDLPTLMDLMRLYRQAGRHADAIKLLEQAIALSTDLPRGQMVEMHGILLDSALAVDNLEAIEGALAGLSALGMEDTPQFRLARARAAMVADKPGEAVELLEALRADHSELATALVPELSRAQAADGRLNAALDGLRALAQVQGGGRDALIWREAISLALQSEATDAVETLARDLLASSVGRPDLRLIGAESLAQIGQTEAALVEMDRLATLAPELTAVQSLRGRILMDMGRSDDAATALRAAVIQAPDQVGYWLSLLGAIHGHDGYGHAGGEGDHVTAAALLDEAITANPNSAALMTELGLLHLSDAELSKAISAFDAALEADPAHVPALSLGALARADAKTKLGQAQDLITRASALTPDEPIILDIEGWIALQKGDLAVAGPLFEAAWSASPDDTTTLYHMAVLAEQEGSLGKARDLYLASLQGGDLYRHYREGARDSLTRLSDASLVSGEMRRISEQGAGEALGSVTISARSEGGITFSFDVSGLPQGMNAAHIHENPSCRPKNGVIGGESGGHYGHAHVHMIKDDGSMMMGDEIDHSKMNHDDMQMDPMAMAKPKGDLDPLMFDASDRTSVSIDAPLLTLEEVRGRSLMIHLGPDKDGESGPKIACAILS